MAGAGDRSAREGEARGADVALDPRGARDRVLPDRPLGGGRGRVPRARRALTRRRVRPLRARPRAREPGPAEGGDAAHQARLARCARARRPTATRSNRRAGGRPARTRGVGHGRRRGRRGDRRRARRPAGRRRRRHAAATPSASPGKVARLRIFENEDGRFDRSLLDVSGEALVVSQFTLVADTRRGIGRASPTRAAAGCRRAALRALLRSARGGGCAAFDGRLRRAHAGRARQRRPRDDRARQVGAVDLEGESRPMPRSGTPPQCYPSRTTFHRLHEMGAPRPFLLRRLDDDHHVRTRTHAAGRDRTRGRVARARSRGARGRASLAEPVLRLRRPSGRRRPCALRARDPRPRRVPLRVHDRCLLARARNARCGSPSTSPTRSASASPCVRPRDGRKNRFRGVLVEAGDDTITLEAGDAGEIRIPYEAIVRANLIDEGLTT